MFVTGTFDDWGKTVRLEQTDHGFEKEVSLPFSKEKIYYKVRTYIGRANLRGEKRTKKTKSLMRSTLVKLPLDQGNHWTLFVLALSERAVLHQAS